MNVTFNMTADGIAINDIKPFLRKSIKQKRIIDFRLVENTNLIKLELKSGAKTIKKVTK